MNRIFSRALCQAPRAFLVDSVPQQALIPCRLFHYKPARLAADHEDKERAAKRAAKKELHANTEIPPLPTLSPEELEKAPYVVRRSSAGGLPFYRKSRNNRMMEWIIIKKIDGDLDLMTRELARYLEIPQEHVLRGELAGQVTVKGHEHQKKIRTWLVEKGF
ncbi:hypothetical protein CDD82_2563 [Ophiocordyceps australis]|uniref:Large ribosomal subunit protein mL49 n=1 Tax=Ophiocordyceps australis TaxID=1399860 RepID=A0A2C5YM57_9HYPO|nr:hypothetical protein CDD82_2563 [Ophiocordyceps australis]